MKGLFDFNKKAEMSSKMIVSLVLLIAGFAILFSVFMSFDWENESERQVCHQSVVLRATTEISGQNMLPLNCKTQKKCVTSGLIGGGCESVFKNSDDVEKVKVSDKEEIEKFIADEIVDCWAMMGEGKLSIFSKSLAERFGIGGIYPSCIVCSRIAFDKEKLGVSDEELKKLDVYGYMKENKIPGKQMTYAEYFGDSETKPTISSDSLKFNVPTEEDDEGNIAKLEEVNLSKEELEDKAEEYTRPEELGIVFMQISSPSHEDSLKNMAKIAGAGAAAGFLSPGGRLIGKVVKLACGGFVRGAICAAVVGTGIAAQQFNVLHQRDVAAGYCTDAFQGKSGSERNGCSVVRVVDYTSEDLTEYCSVIESEM